MTSLPKNPTPASVRELLLGKARAFLQSQGVDVAAELGTRARAPAVSERPPPAPVTASSRRDKRAAAALEHQRQRPLSRGERKERAERELERVRRKADARYQARFAQRSAQWGAEVPTGGFRCIPREVWLMGWHCASDATGQALRYWMEREPNKVAVGAARAAALGELYPGGPTTRSWADPTARSMMTFSLGLLRLAVPTARKGRWGAVVRGVGLGALARLLVPPGCGARVPHRNRLSGRHRGAGSAPGRGQLGYLQELARTGFLYSQQLPAGEVDRFEVGSSGYANNRYWLVAPASMAPLDDATRALLIALHRAGQRASSEKLESPKSPHKSRAQHPLEPAQAAPPAPS